MLTCVQFDHLDLPECYPHYRSAVAAGAAPARFQVLVLSGQSEMKAHISLGIGLLIENPHNHPLTHTLDH